MPANRSRTERWLDCLYQLYERGGAIEMALSEQGAHNGVRADAGSDVAWRVKILRMSDTEMLVERPSAFGHALPMDSGLGVVGVMSIGQNRWMFRTKVVGIDLKYPGGAVRLAMPTSVERCRRREFYRVSATSLRLPKVMCWPLLDPMSVVVAELANKATILDLQNGGQPRGEAELLPEVGPGFMATLMNLGGGGIGLLVDKDEASRVDSSRLLWMRLDLTPQIAAPIGVTARIAHVHRDSEQNLYVGGAFDFSFHPAHKEFVVSQMTRYVQTLLGERRAAA